MKKIISLFLITVLATSFWGCEKKKDSAPALPPAGTMSIDFSNFATAAKSDNSDRTFKDLAASDKTNWALASTVAGFWNLVLAANLVVPVASFGVAVDKTPTYLDNNKWQWSYNFNVIGASYKARLTGEVTTSNVVWEMYVSKDGVGAFPELLWYSGTSNLDGKGGQWILNHSQGFPEPALQIDWKITGDAVGNVKYTYIREKKDDRSIDPFKTSYIEYGLTTSSLNAFYNIHQNTGVTGIFNDVSIEWSTTDHNGHIKANYYYQDILWHCWNGIGDNVNCN
jgi:hypothetical protein